MGDQGHVWYQLDKVKFEQLYPIPFNHILNISGEYLNYLPRLNYLRARVGQSRAETEDMEYNTHLAKILSAGQGLCN